MATNTRTWAEAVGLTQARAGASFAAGTELDNIGFLLNSAARTIYDESRYWERQLVVEPRTVSRGYVAYTEDSYNVYGAGTSEVNGLYVRNGDSADGNPAYTLYESDGVTAKYNLWSTTNTRWIITSTDVDGQAVSTYYQIVSSSNTPPEGAWKAGTVGEEPAPIVQATSEIGEYIGHWDGELWTCADTQRGQAYPDHNGIKIANCNHGDTVWVAYKKEFTDTYGDGENGTVSDIPAEWIEFMSYDAARAYAASQGNQDGYNPVAIRDVDRALERALMKVSRQGINETIALYFRTNYGYDVSVK
jgi:hypothetical protein